MKTDKGIFGHIGSAIFIACVGVACATTNAGLVTPNHPTVTDQSDCAAACATLHSLGCAQGNPISMGTKCGNNADCKDLNGNSDPKQQCAADGTCMVTCVTFCIDTENQGVWLDPTCVKDVTSCDQVDKCPLPAPRQPSCTGPGCQLSPR